MNKEEFELSRKAYAPLIERIIKDDYKYLRFKETIKWGFVCDDNIRLFGAHDRKTNILKINLLAVMNSYMKNDMYTIEYFVLHEIRHIFQQLEMDDYKAGNETVVNEDLVKKWIYEQDNYVTALNKDGKENKDYFAQDLEMDAYAFAYAVMSYKYGDNLGLYVPEDYGEEFFNIVKEWKEMFKNDSL